MQHADDVYAKICKVADVHDISTLHDIFIKCVGRSICHSIREYWATHSHVDVTNIAFKAQSLVEVQKGVAKAANVNIQAASSKIYQKRTWNNPSAHSIKI